jgi:hypothetical protein
MRRILSGLSAVVLGGLFSSCGNGPLLLTGNMRYSWGCTFEMGTTPDTTHPTCMGGTWDLAGQLNTGSPPLVVGCTVSPGSGGVQTIRFRIGRSLTGNLDGGEGLTVCGNLANTGQELTRGTADIYVRGSAATAVPLASTCHVRINSVMQHDNLADFAGQMACDDAHDNLVPYRKLFIRGLAGGASATQDPAQADFSFQNCSTQPLAPCQ